MNGGAIHHYNTIYASFVALGMFAPSRQAEITTLPVNCITTSVDEVQGRTRMGLRWRPAKGGQAITKFSVGAGKNPEWEAVASEAVNRLELMGRSARRAAKWYAENPDRLYLPPGTEHLRGQALTWVEVAEILDWDPAEKPAFRPAFRMSKALEKVGETRDPERMGELKKIVREVGHAYLYTYESVVTLAKQRVYAKNVKQGPNVTRMKAWFAANPEQLEMPDDLKHLDGQPLTQNEVVRLLNSYSDSNGMNTIASRYIKVLVRAGTTTDPTRVDRREYDHAAKRNSSRPTYSQRSVGRYLRRYISDYVGPLPAHLEPIADWFRENPEKMYLPEHLRHIGEGPLTMTEALSIVGLTEKDLEKPNSIRFITTDCLEVVGTAADSDRERSRGVRSLATYTFESLERFVLGRLQGGFPIVDAETRLPFSDALFCLAYNSQNAENSTFWNVPFWVNYNSISTALVGQNQGRQKALTIFTRNNLVNRATGKPWTLKTHQMRHLLNTLAQGKYLSQALIAFWSGRKSVAQNSLYDHVPQEQVIEAWHMLDEKSGVEVNVTGALAEKAGARSINEAISYDEALKLELGAIHVTSKGLCRHNFALTPCPKDKDCDNCGESILVAHDERFISDTQKQIALHDNALTRSLEAKAEGEPGVDRWIAKHEQKLARLQLKKDLITDPSTPAGTIMSMPPPDHDQTRSGLVMDEVAARQGQGPEPGPEGSEIGVQLDPDAMFNKS